MIEQTPNITSPFGRDDRLSPLAMTETVPGWDILTSDIDRVAQFGVLAGLSLALFGASSSLTTALVQATWRRGGRSVAEAAVDAKQELDELLVVQKLRLAALYTALQLG